MAKSNLAYDFNLNKKRKLVSPQKQKINILRVKKKKIKRLKPSSYIFLIISSFLILCLYISYIVRGSELTFKIDSAKKQYNIQKSEAIRLNSELETKYLNSTEIEKYAKLNLGMKKQNNNQVQYICTKRGNLCETPPKQNLKKTKSIKNKLSNLKEHLNSFFKEG